MSLFRYLAIPRCVRSATRLAVGVLFVCTALASASVSAQETAAPEKAAEKTPAPESPPAESDAKTDETKPDETKPKSPEPAEKEEKKPDSEKPAETKPAETKPAETKPAETKPAEMKPAEKKPAKKKPEPAKPEPAPKPEPVADPTWVAKGVWTMPPTRGPEAVDFSLVGEYVGELKSDEPKSKDAPATRLGVQIRALGNGQFEARAYQGGLPGQDGFENKKPMLLFGRRSGETLVLSGGPWAMFAGPERCRIINAEGATLAELPRENRVSPTLGAAPPQGAMVLFNGTDTSAFSTATMTEEKLLAQGADINFMLGDFDLHLEFRIPHMPKQTEQKRGNSGLYLQSRYECQVLDSFGEANLFNGLGALYRFKTPKMNMAFPPLTWQTYDIHFTGARYAADGSKLRNARVTSWVNGVIVQDDEELPGPTGAGKPESPTLLPTKIQDHGDPVRFRNIWVIDRGLTGGIPFPVGLPIGGQLSQLSPTSP